MQLSHQCQQVLNKLLGHPVRISQNGQIQIISFKQQDGKFFIPRVLAYDFDRDIAPVLRYLVDIGIGARNIAEVASNAPMLFQHSVQVRSKNA